MEGGQFFGSRAAVGTPYVEFPNSGRLLGGRVSKQRSSSLQAGYVGPESEFLPHMDDIALI